MPRPTRTYLPGIPVQTTQLGKKWQSCFFRTEDCLFYLSCLKHALARYQVRLHAYVLMSNHVHLLLTPAHHEGIPAMMAFLGCRYVAYLNRCYARNGSLWEGRYRARLIDAENSLLACCRHIELNPVRAGLVGHPGHYFWSSYRHNAHGGNDELLTQHPSYRALSGRGEERQQRYRKLFLEGGEVSPTGDRQGVIQGRFPPCKEKLRRGLESKDSSGGGPIRHEAAGPQLRLLTPQAAWP